MSRQKETKLILLKNPLFLKITENPWYINMHETSWNRLCATFLGWSGSFDGIFNCGVLTIGGFSAESKLWVDPFMSVEYAINGTVLDNDLSHYDRTKFCVAQMVGIAQHVSLANTS